MLGLNKISFYFHLHLSFHNQENIKELQMNSTDILVAKTKYQSDVANFSCSAEHYQREKPLSDNNYSIE